MKTFISYLTEIAWQQSTSKMVFGWSSFDYVMLPLSPSILGRVMEQTRDTVFHVLSWKDINNSKRLQGKKKSISAFFRMEAESIEDGVQSGGAIVAELEANVLFSGEEDIMSKPDKTRDEIIKYLKNKIDKAIEMAHLKDFISTLAQGDKTLVGERGLKVSGGEKQRIAIARAILKQSPILIFDEATSALDSHAEQAILKAMRDVTQNHTSIVIAHRLSTIVDADNILVFKKGELVEQGTHSALLLQNGQYAQMWQLQQQDD